MTVTAKMYGTFIQKALNKEIDWDSDNIRVALLSSSYTPDQDNHSYWSSTVTYEITGTGYTANGATLANAISSYTNSSNVIKLSGDNTSWTGATFTARYAVIYDRTPASDASRPLCGYIDFGADMSPINGTLQLTWDSSGIFTITVS